MDRCCQTLDPWGILSPLIHSWGQWTSLMMAIQRIPHACKRDKAALRRFLEALLWILRTGTPWRDLPEGFGL